MTLFRALLVAAFLVVGTYTAITIANHGATLLPVFLGDIAGMTWRGQFNVDFWTYLVMTGLWVAWRDRFSGRGVALGLAASVLGMPFLSAYLLVASVRSGGDPRRILLGVHADAPA